MREEWLFFRGGSFLFIAEAGSLKDFRFKYK